MTHEQEKHVIDITDMFVSRMMEKYELGAREHGGNLWDKNPIWLIDQAMDEAIDQFVYLYTIKQKLLELNAL